MLEFVKPNAVFLLKDRNLEEKSESTQYAYFDRAFIVTNESGYNNLLKHAELFFNDDVVEFFDDFIATKNIDYIISVQWGIFETFLRSVYDRISNGNKNIPHIVYDIYMNPTYRKYFPFLRFDEELLVKSEDKMDKNTYDLLSFEDICNLDTDIAIKHITAHIQITCDQYTFEHYFKNMNYKSCVQSICNPENVIVPVEVIENDLFKLFKNSYNASYKIYKELEKNNYEVAKTLIPGSAERQLIIEITLEELFAFMHKYETKELTMDTMEIKTLNYLMCDLISSVFNIFVLDRMDGVKALLASDSNKIADALSIWNNF